MSVRSLGNRFFSFLLSVIYNQNISDSNNLLRGFSKEVFNKLNLREKGEGVMFEMTLKALKNKLKIDEFPTEENAIAIPRSRRNRFVSALHFALMLLRG